MSAIILFRSLTYAQRGVRVLSGGGIPATLIKAPAETASRGCAYAAVISRRRLREAVEMLDKASLPHGLLYEPDGNDGYKEVKL